MKEMNEAAYSTIRDTYAAQVTIPTTKPSTQYLLCPIGLVGAGKTTVVKPLAEALSLVRISGDEIRKLCKENGYGYERVYDLTFELIDRFLSEGHSVCIDSDCASKIKQIKDTARQRSVKVIWIHINPPESFIINKLSHLKTNWLGTGAAMVANYYQRKPLHKNIDLNFTVTFDTSRPDLEEQIQAATPQIQKAVGL